MLNRYLARCFWNSSPTLHIFAPFWSIRKLDFWPLAGTMAPPGHPSGALGIGGRWRTKSVILRVLRTNPFIHVELDGHPKSWTFFLRMWVVCWPKPWTLETGGVSFLKICKWYLGILMYLECEAAPAPGGALRGNFSSVWRLALLVLQSSNSLCSVLCLPGYPDLFTSERKNIYIYNT